MTKQKDIPVVFFTLGLTFITLGITLGNSNPGLKLFTISGVLFLVSSLLSWRASRKKTKTSTTSKKL